MYIVHIHVHVHVVSKMYMYMYIRHYGIWKRWISATSACVMCNVHVKEDKYTNIVVPIVRLVGLLPLANARPRQDVMGKVHVQCIIGERERANLVVQLARIFYIYIYISLCLSCLSDHR